MEFGQWLLFIYPMGLWSWTSPLNINL